MKRDWKDAREKVDGQPCRVCARQWPIEACHVIGRIHDVRQRGSSVAYVNPDSVVPLCGPATSTGSCHGMYDAHRLDLLPYLTEAEQVQAVKDAGGLMAAMRRICGERQAA